MISTCLIRTATRSPALNHSYSQHVCRKRPTTLKRHTSNASEIDTVPLLLPRSFAIGGFAGVLGSLAGMGGGFVMVPAMVSLLKLSQHQAHGTSLFAVAATGVAGAVGYEGYVHYDAAAAIALGGSVTAGLGAAATSRLSGPALKKALGIFMLAVAPLVPLKGYLLQNQAEFSLRKEQEKDTENQSTKTTTTLSNDNSSNAASWERKLLPPAIIGLGSGFLAGLFGMGGGAIVVPALTLFTDVNHYEVLGTSLCAMVLPGITGTITHFQKGNVAMRVAPTVAAGAFCGAYLGGHYLGIHTNEDVLRWGFSGIMVTLGMRALIK
jgi:uncharacterized protein